MLTKITYIIREFQLCRMRFSRTLAFVIFIKIDQNSF